MPQGQRTIRAKLRLLELARQLGSVSQACQIMGYSRDSFYRIKALYEQGGELALQEISRRQPILKNRTAPEIEAAVAEMAIAQPGWGQVRVSEALARRGLSISPAGVRCVWQRHDLTSKRDRLEALQAQVAQDGLLLTPAQITALAKAQAKAGQAAPGGFRSEYPGYCVARDTIYVGTLPGVGRVCQQTFIDTYAQLAFAQLYDRQTLITTVEFLDDRVEPFYQEHGIRLSGVLTKHSPNFSDCQEPALSFTVEDLPPYSRPRAKGPQTDGSCERFHRGVLAEFYRVAFRQKIYRTLAELQVDLDAWLAEYNERRPYQGRWCFGKTPLQTFLAALPLAQAKNSGPLEIGMTVR